MSDNYTIPFEVIKFNNRADMDSYMMTRLETDDAIAFIYSGTRIIRTMKSDGILSTSINDRYDGYEGKGPVMLYHSMYHDGCHLDKYAHDKDHIFLAWDMCFLSNERTRTLNRRKYAKPAVVERETDQ